MKQHIDLEQLRTIAQKNDYDTFAEFYRLIRNDKNTSYNGIKRFYDRLRSYETLGFDKLLSEINIGKLIDIASEDDSIDIKGYILANTWLVETKAACYIEDNLVDALFIAMCRVLEVKYE